MTDYSLDQLHAAKDVVWDFEVSRDLAETLTAAAKLVDEMVAPRNSRELAYGQHFVGYYADLWKHNIDTANSDARFLAMRLREVAKGVRALEEDARAEQARINAAREWKARRDARSGWDKAVDTIDFLNLLGNDAPPASEPLPQMNKTYSQATKGSRHEFTGNSASQVTSALPDDLRSFSSEERAANDIVRGKPTELQSKLDDFRERCRWGQLSADSVIAGFRTYIDSNDVDAARLEVVAAAFEAAGGSGEISTLSNGAIAEALRSNGISEQRQKLEIPPVQAVGNPPSTGYSNDPVNTATGNFVENEEDLRYEGASSLLGWARSYSSQTVAAGGHGIGWSSWDRCNLRFSDDGATWTLMDGREVEFPRDEEGFGRAAYDNFWLESADSGRRSSNSAWVVSNNAGARWEFDTNGRILAFIVGEGAALSFIYDEAHLVQIRHLRGRSLTLEWDGELISAVTLDDGRRMDYSYDNGRLIKATGPLGVRQYEWNAEGLISAVIDADGICEARNTYDEYARVTTQVSPHGRTTRFSYLPGRVTSVSDEDGTRANTWVADPRGRVTGIVDADGNRTTLGYDRWGNLCWTMDAEGKRTAREFDRRGRLIQEMIPSKARSRLEYDDHDRLLALISVEEGEEVTRTSFEYEGTRHQPTAVIDGEGGRTELRWESGLLMSITDPTGVAVSFEYDTYGDVISSTDGAGNITRVVRGENALPLRVISPSGAITAYSYSDAGLLTSRKDPDGALWRYEYSSGGKLTTIIDPLDGRTTLEYGDHGDLRAVIDPLGRRVEQTVDDLGNLSSIVLPDGATWQFTHDASSRLTCSIDPSGGVWTRTYNHYGQLNSEVDPTGVTSRFWHANGKTTLAQGAETTQVDLDRWGRPSSTTTPDGSTSSIRYDKVGRVIESVDETGGRTTIERDKAGRPVRVVQPSGAVPRYDYDEAGRLAGVRNPLGMRTALVYDEDSRVVAHVLPTGERARATYDACGRPTMIHRPGAGTFRFTYDLLGRVIESRDPANGTRRFTYDAAGQLIAATGGTGGVTRWEYDANGRAITITDAAGGVTRRTFDAMDRCTSETNPLGATMRASYDAAGRVSEAIDADGNVISIEYSNNARTTTLRANGELMSVSSIDAVNRRRTVEDYSAGVSPLTHIFSYDPRGLLTSYQRGEAHMRWEYDADGNRCAFTAPNGATTRYRHDEAGNLIRVQREDGPAVSIQRDEAGRHISATVGEAHYEWEYSNGFATRHRAVVSGKESADWRIDYTEDGLIASVTHPAGRTRYEYDDANQLTAVHGPEGTHLWTYDLAGRLTEESFAEQRWQRAYNAAGQLLKATNGGEEISYSYDRSGRRISERHSSGQVREYSWNAKGQLAGIHEGGAGSIRAQVDALGYVSDVDGQQVYIDPTTGAIAQFGEQDCANAGPLTAVGGAWGDPSWRSHRYAMVDDPYETGAGGIETGAGNNVRVGVHLGPDGALHIAGLEWLGARQFDSATRSFISPDPLESITGAGWAGNPYSYAGNNPLNLFDPTGLQPVTAEQLDGYRKANAPKWGTAIAIVAGIGLAFVPGMQGFSAALITGAVLGGGGSIIDQAVSGYPIDWGEATVATVFGMMGGSIGYGVGRGMQAFARTDVGKKMIWWGMEKARKIPTIDRLLKGESDQYVNMVDAQRTQHILFGDSNGGGHRWPGRPGKTPYPASWSEARIMHNVNEILTDVDVDWIQQTGPIGQLKTRAGDASRFKAEHEIEGVELRVIYAKADGQPPSAFPTSYPPSRKDVPTLVGNQTAVQMSHLDVE